MEKEPYFYKYINYYQAKVDNDLNTQNRIHKEIDNLMVIPDNIYNNYPDYNNPDFIYEISNKLEFFHMKSLLNITDLSEKCNLRDPKKNDFQFELSNNQQFLRNFINKNTPYRGLVIFHGVGVGKTCSAINISRSFRDIYMSNKEKIICLVPKNIRGGWENTIYDKTKGKEQCSGDNFEDIIMNDKSYNGRISDKKVKDIIKNYYEFYGYLKFANHVKKLIKTTIGNQKLDKEEYEKKEREIIKNNFSHRILIIDEIHNLREENDENNKSDIDFKIKRGIRILWEDRRGVIRYGTVVSSEELDGNKIYTIQREDNEELEKVHVDNIKRIKNEDKKARDMIEKVIAYSEGLRLIMLSATPMFNKSTEIIWLLNLLLKNDNRPLITYEEIFKKSYSSGGGDVLTKKGKEIISQKSRGYFSYLRGENPISFPIRFYPDINNDPLCMGGNHNKKIKYSPYPDLSLFLKDGKHISIKNRYQFKFMKMYNTLMIDKQKKIYEDFINHIQNIKKLKSLRLSDRNIGLQISNITYTQEGEEDDFSRSFGKVGYNKYFKDKIERKQKLCSYIDDKNPILDIDNLKNISIKMHTILRNMLSRNTEGIIFIYSDFIYSGILPLALALEHIGFEKYGGNNLLNYPEWKKGSKGNLTKREPIDNNFKPMSKSKNKHRAKYIILTGDKSLSPNNELERKASLHENNIYGENIKIILGNVVTSEGMDFKNFREVHVLDPWYHLYKIEQIIGRGIRFCSHSLQPKEKQNVTVYLHTSSIENRIESIDTNTYRIAEEKASQIGKIEKILKNNSIDCFLNKQINYITGLKDIYMKTSSNSNKSILVDINDKDYTKICSFSGSEHKEGNKGCEIECNISEEKYNKLIDNIEDENISSIDIDTFTVDNISESIQLIYKIIKELYNEYNVYSLKELIESISKLIDTNQKIIYHSLESIIDNKLVIWNNGISGYIIENNDYYLFQPFHNKDIYTPYIYRTKYEDAKHNQNYIYSSDLTVQIKDDIKCNMNYNDIYEIIKNRLDNLSDDINYYSTYIPNIKPQIFIDNYIDSLKYEEKVILLKEILCEYINNKYKGPSDKVDLILFNFFKNNLIYIDSSQGYHILDEDAGTPIGFFLYNTKNYYQNTKKEVLDDFTYFQYDKTKLPLLDPWSKIDNVGINSLKQNFLKNKKKKKYFKTTQIWGYSFKDESFDHIFKIIDSPTYDNKVPGKIIGNKGVKPVTLLKEFSYGFNGIFKQYINDLIKKIKGKIKTNKKELDNFNTKIKNKDDETLIKEVMAKFNELTISKKKIINKDGQEKEVQLMSKEFIKLLFEYSLRQNFIFLNYDLFLLKYIS